MLYNKKVEIRHRIHVCLCAYMCVACCRDRHECTIICEEFSWKIGQACALAHSVSLLSIKVLPSKFKFIWFSLPFSPSIVYLHSFLGTPLPVVAMTTSQCNGMCTVALDRWCEEMLTQIFSNLLSFSGFWCECVCVCVCICDDLLWRKSMVGSWLFSIYPALILLPEMIRIHWHGTVISTAQQIKPAAFNVQNRIIFEWCVYDHRDVCVWHRKYIQPWLYSRPPAHGHTDSCR